MIVNLEESLTEKSHKNDRLKIKIFIYACTTMSIIAMILEILGGFFSNSLSIMSDAINTLPDIFIFTIACISESHSKSLASKMSYGYYRFEILGFLMSTSIV